MMDAASDACQRTWDGQPISQDPPFGAVVIVYRQVGRHLEFLILHRAHHGPAFAGEWAWGPPSGARYPGEPIDGCAERELFEETHLTMHLRQTSDESAEWVVYLAEAPPQTSVLLSNEHDRYAWLPAEEATAAISPDFVRAQFAAAAGLVRAATETDSP